MDSVEALSDVIIITNFAERNVVTQTNTVWLSRLLVCANACGNGAMIVDHTLISGDPYKTNFVFVYIINLL